MQILKSRYTWFQEKTCFHSHFLDEIPIVCTCFRFCQFSCSAHKRTGDCTLKLTHLEYKHPSRDHITNDDEVNGFLPDICFTDERGSLYGKDNSSIVDCVIDKRLHETGYVCFFWNKFCPHKKLVSHML